MNAVANITTERRLDSPTGAASRNPSVVWIGALDGELAVRAGGWRETLVPGWWLLLDGSAEAAFHAEPVCSWVHGRLPLSDLGGASQFAECASCQKRATPKLAGGVMDAAMRVAALQLASLRGRSLSEELSARGLLLQILGRVVAAEEARAAVGCPYCPADLCCIERAARYLEERFPEDLSLARVARAASTNEFKLKQGFRRVFGTTVFGYLRKVRMQRARKRFDSGERNVTGVAMEVGYSNPSHFARAFRSEFGLNPKAYVLHARR